MKRLCFKHELKGKKFGELTVIKTAGMTISKKRKWLCQCSCGKLTVAQTQHLLEGRRVSCGCRKLDRSRFRGPAENQVVRDAIRNTKRECLKKGRIFQLTEEQVKNFIFNNCYYCGSKPKSQHNVKYREVNQTITVPVMRNGIDRVDNNVGYILENCVTCCYYCNRAKMNMPINEFKVYIEQLYKNFCTKS